MSLDRDFLGPREHVMNIHAERRDTADLLRLQRQVESDSSEGRRGYFLWRITAAIGDSAARATRRQRLDSLAFREGFAALAQAHRDALDQEDVDTLLAVLERRATSNEARQFAFSARAVAAVLRGTPAVAVAAGGQVVANGGSRGFNAIVGVFDALYADGDTANAVRLIPKFVPYAEAPRGATRADRAVQYGATCWLEQWRLAHGDTRSAARAVSRLRSAAEPADSFTTVGEAHLCAAMLDAWIATVSERPDADQARLALDSLMRTAPPFWIPYQGAVPANQLLARLFAAVGDTTRALAAIRRYQKDYGFDVLRAKNLRLEGRLAAAVGDTSGAIRAYRAYLILRSHPEPLLVPQRDSVRSELEVLLHGPVPREAS
jgi:hypothetical protein